jgi:hypothetical protein
MLLKLYPKSRPFVVPYPEIMCKFCDYVIRHYGSGLVRVQGEAKPEPFEPEPRVQFEVWEIPELN